MGILTSSSGRGIQAFMGSGMDAIGMLSNAAPDCGDVVSAATGSDAAGGYGYGSEELQKEIIQDYSRHCNSYLAPYIIAVTINTW